jgi:hypothetical protein
VEADDPWDAWNGNRMEEDGSADPVGTARKPKR